MQKLKQRMAWLLIMIIIMTATPFSLAEEEGKIVAKIVDFSGDVQMMQAGKETGLKAFKGMSLTQGDSIETGLDSWVNLEIDRYKEVKIGADTLIQVTTLKEKIGDSVGKTKLSLATGEIWVDINKKLEEDSKFEIKTPTAIMGVRGTKFYVGEEDEKTNVKVVEGVVAFSREKKDKEKLNKKQGSVVEENQEEVLIFKGQEAVVERSDASENENTELESIIEVEIEELKVEKLNDFVLESIKESPDRVDADMLEKVDKQIEINKQIKEQELNKMQPDVAEDNINENIIYDENNEGSSSSNTEEKSEKSDEDEDEDRDNNRDEDKDDDRDNDNDKDDDDEDEDDDDDEDEDDDEIISVEKIVISNNSIELEIGKSFTLSAEINPQNASDKSLNWSSENSNIASVSSSGKVIAVSEGETNVIVSTSNDKTSKCLVKVISKEVEVSSITLNVESLEMNVGESAKIIATIDPVEAENKDIQWSSSDNNIVKVDGTGNVLAIKEGQADIIAKVDNGVFAKCSIVTKAVPEPTPEPTPSVVEVESVSLLETALDLDIGESWDLTPTILPADATDKNLSWSSSDINVATIDNSGRVTVVGAGNTTLRAETSNGKQATCQLTGRIPHIETTGIEVITGLTNEKVQINSSTGDKVITARVLPTDATAQQINWTVNTTPDKVNLIESDGGKTLTIQALSNDDFQNGATYSLRGETADTNVFIIVPIEIVQDSIPLTGINLETTKSIGLGRTIQLVYSLEPSNTTDSQLIWSSDDESIARSVGDGSVEGIAEGNTTIRVRNSDGSVNASCDVIVEPVWATHLTLNVSDKTLDAGDTYQLIATLEPDDVTNPVLTWTSSDENIVRVDDQGLVTAVGGGVASISVDHSPSNIPAASCEFTVKVQANDIVITSDSYLDGFIEIGALFSGADVTATLLPSGVSNQTINWTISDSSKIDLIVSDNGRTLDISGNVDDAPEIGDIYTLTGTSGDGQVVKEFKVKIINDAPSPA
jgi:uncharacterized protein YjdB